MPLRKFICPDKEEIEISKCLAESGCRMCNRCAARPVLKVMAASDREWKGNPSTTQLIKGTQEAFLAITQEYATSPDRMAFMILGSSGHYILEKQGDDISQAELDLGGGTGSIRPDSLECEGGTNILIDYKTSGSYVVAKALGIFFEEVPTVDPITEQLVLYKTGPRKGKPRTHKERRIDPKLADVRDWALQLNNYRMRLEKECVKGPDGKFYRKDENPPKDSSKFKVNRIKAQVIVRDGNTMMALSRGIDRNIYLIDIPRIPDEQVKEYFKRKTDDLLQALKQGYWSTPCNDIERWEGKKCQEYCPVNKFCAYWIETYSKNIDVEDQAGADTEQIGEDGCPL